MRQHVLTPSAHCNHKSCWFSPLLQPVSGPMTDTSLKGCPGWSRLTVNLASFCANLQQPSSCDCSRKRLGFLHDEGVAPRPSSSLPATSCPSPLSSRVLPAPAKAQHGPGTQSPVSECSEKVNKEPRFLERVVSKMVAWLLSKGLG